MPPTPLQFVIVDIETNGGPPDGENITEIAAILHDGRKELDRWVHLIRPDAPIPAGITRLTGIDDAMVADAPPCGSLAEDLLAFLGDAVFVAHNVAFDLRHIQSAFKRCGMHYNPRRLCTVRMSRKWLEGPQRFSLGALCAYFDIENEAHHRAWGDAAATAAGVTGSTLAAWRAIGGADVGHLDVVVRRRPRGGDSGGHRALAAVAHLGARRRHPATAKRPASAPGAAARSTTAVVLVALQQLL